MTPTLFRMLLYLTKTGSHIINLFLDLFLCSFFIFHMSLWTSFYSEDFTCSAFTCSISSQTFTPIKTIQFSPSSVFSLSLSILYSFSSYSISPYVVRRISAYFSCINSHFCRKTSQIVADCHTSSHHIASYQEGISHIDSLSGLVFETPEQLVLQPYSVSVRHLAVALAVSHPYPFPVIFVLCTAPIRSLYAYQR
jgi:hypothetical protein